MKKNFVELLGTYLKARELMKENTDIDWHEILRRQLKEAEKELEDYLTKMKKQMTASDMVKKRNKLKGRKWVAGNIKKMNAVRLDKMAKNRKHPLSTV